MLRQICDGLKRVVKTFWSLFSESWSGKKLIFISDKKDLIKLIGLEKSSTIFYDSEKDTFNIDTVRLGALFTSHDIINSAGKFVISSENDDEKTEFYDIVCNTSFTIENNIMKISKTFRRLTFYRNSKGRLVNIIVGHPRPFFENIPLNILSNNS